MDITKYIDMAYGNPKGRQWLNILFRPDIWAKWNKKIQARAPINKYPGAQKNYAQRIVIEAVWHFGYAQDYSNIKEMSRCARRLRNPPDRGAGDINSGICGSERDFLTTRLPWELQELDDFLEHYVRPLVP